MNLPSKTHPAFKRLPRDHIAAGVSAHPTGTPTERTLP